MFGFGRGYQQSFLTCAPVIPQRRIRICVRSGDVFDLTADRIEDTGEFCAYRDGRKIADFGYGVRWWMEIETDDGPRREQEAGSADYTSPAPCP